MMADGYTRTTGKMLLGANLEPLLRWFYSYRPLRTYWSTIQTYLSTKRLEPVTAECPQPNDGYSLKVRKSVPGRPRTFQTSGPWWSPRMDLVSPTLWRRWRRLTGIIPHCCWLPRRQSLCSLCSLCSKRAIFPSVKSTAHGPCQAANKTIGQGGFQEVEQMAMFKDSVCYQEEAQGCWIHMDSSSALEFLVNLRKFFREVDVG